MQKTSNVGIKKLVAKEDQMTYSTRGCTVYMYSVQYSILFVMTKLSNGGKVYHERCLQLFNLNFGKIITIITPTLQIMWS
jgi:hypothetical protein